MIGRQLDWRRVEDDVRRLRQRIFTASKAGDLARVRQLQKLMLRSRANTLVSVRRVTERNAGRLTAGVDGEVVLTPEAKAKIGRQDPAAQPSRSRPCRSDACTSPSRAAAEAPAARNSRDPRQVPPGTGRGRAGARVGGQVRAEVLRVSAGPWLPRRDPRRSTRSSRARARNGSGCWTQTWHRRSTASRTTTSWPCSARSPPGGWSRSG